MDDAAVLESVSDVIRTIIDNPNAELNLETTADETKGWDSAAHITIVVAIEQLFGIKFKTAEIEELRNVGEFVQLIQKKLARKG